ncbi:MAG: DUF3429 domain-containing protein [Ectothiorhodospiraceae bacterium]|nr:DUF3429 domain-containing protein [Ectothiorhodospiraceae bacterium]MCH8505533.1 DUF3429 domain-containing protein [Ectothiorhodospiraceae bacterium]
MQLHLPRDTRKTAVYLGAAGAIPFILGALAAWTIGDSPVGRWTVGAATLYGAVILSFLGGIQWGWILQKPDSQHSLLALSVFPALLAWVALLLSDRFTLGVLIVCFPACFLLDMRLSLPAWFRTLRAALTIVVVACLVAILVALSGNA